MCMDALLFTLHSCSNLTTLKLVACATLIITCKPESWSLLPPTLQELWCDCYFTMSGPFEALIRRLRVLCVRGTPPGCMRSSLLELLQQFPLLEMFKMLSLDEFAIDCVDDDLSSVQSLHK